MQVSEIMTGPEPLAISRRGRWHVVVLLSREEEGQVDEKNKERLDFALTKEAVTTLEDYSYNKHEIHFESRPIFTLF